MRSLEELIQIREQMKDKVSIRTGSKEIRVVVGMGTVGIAAGARAVLGAFVEAVANEGLSERVSVMQNGCIDAGNAAPVVEIYENGKEKTVYSNMTPEMAIRVTKEHLCGGKPVEEYKIGKTNL